MPQFKLYIYNDTDLDNKLYPNDYVEEIIIDNTHDVEYYFEDIIAKVEQATIDGKNRTQKITSFNKYIFKFIRDVDFAEFISEIKLHSNFYFRDHKGDTITPDQWDFEITELDNEFNPNYREIKIEIFTDFVTTKNNNSNLTLYSEPNKAPVASNLSISGTFTLGEEKTLTYTYADEDGDLEGSSLFQWFRYDDENGTNKTAISGATSINYTITISDYNKYISCRVTPVAQTGTTPGTAVQSPLYACDINFVPEARNVDMSPAEPKINTSMLGTYDYYDADADLEDKSSTVYAFYVANNSSGAEKIKIKQGLAKVYKVAPEYLGKYLAVSITPYAQTGNNPGIESFSQYKQITSL